ncbi:hypothetical protein [Microcoleus sp. LEGE 07076]|uniref:hypothetical protein n=1 Tax=Microcoleus sp. LEGE 07076 TaxID=915322 RepID=UPI001880C084|nr:hypothetical protein [Microcoleus sp. LEGE 07076]
MTDLFRFWAVRIPAVLLVLNQGALILLSLSSTKRAVAVLFGCTAGSIVVWASDRESWQRMLSPNWENDTKDDLYFRSLSSLK